MYTKFLQVNICYFPVNGKGITEESKVKSDLPYFPISDHYMIDFYIDLWFEHYKDIIIKKKTDI